MHRTTRRDIFPLVVSDRDLSQNKLDKVEGRMGECTRQNGSCSHGEHGKDSTQGAGDNHSNQSIRRMYKCK